MNEIELPRYRCHKEVWALKIKEVGRNGSGGSTSDSDGSAILRFEDRRYAPIRVTRDYVLKHNPKAGGYFVIYQGGYQSWSPAEAFESGYTLVSE